jgi:ATP-dependent DNA helicase DinG
MGREAVDPVLVNASEPGSWLDASAARRAVFACLESTGGDPAVDGLFRLRALRRDAAGRWELFERTCDPFPGAPDDAATRRMVLEHGVTGADLEGAPPAAEVAREFLDFLGAGPVVAVEGAVAAVWLRHLAGERATPSVLGLDEGAALLLPGRADVLPSRCNGPREVQAALAAVVGGFLSLPQDVLAFAAAGLAAAHAALEQSDPDLAVELGLWLTLCEHPHAWSHDPDQLYRLHPGLVNGRVSASARADATPAELARALAETLEPRCAAVCRLWDLLERVPIDARSELELEPDDLRAIDEVFEVHLPALAQGERGFVYRPGQHQVAREVARSLGGGELLLVSAPTGTGKTLAYMVPAILWSLRNEVRVGISTYTRALQEQAAAREIPRALDALARAGQAKRPRVSVLKGRANYLCWRALRGQTPEEDDGAEAWLAWTLVTLFALCDEEGDLDRLPLRFPLGSRELALAQHGTGASRYQRGLETLVRAVRAQTACCARAEDCETCAAHVARVRAERSHIVITNHAFALARQDFFKHMVFDECEHLHDQAHNAWSHTLAPSEVRTYLARLRQGGRSGARGPLERAARLTRGDEAASEALRAAELACDQARLSLGALERALSAFKAWREQAQATCDERDEHALLREFVEHAGEIPEAAPLLVARLELALAVSALDAALSDLAGRLEVVPAHGLARVRRGLELARTDLAPMLEALEAWLPLVGGEPKLRPETFHDVETDLRGEDLLAARVLLPNEFLGRFYYPQLSSAVLISATTWIQGGFESASGFLGLDRAADPAPGEEREPCSVRTYRAPEVFDYGRVLVGVPRDAPDVRERERFLAFVRRFVAHLGERTRGRMLVLFTNADDLRRVGEALSGFFRARHVPLWWQGMPGVAKEELARLFRSRRDSILLGLDTFWFGADFPGETLEYLVLARLPYGVPDRYHHAQCAALGAGEQRRRIYMPRALAKLRQGFGRLMRRESDRGCVFVLDRRVLDPRHRSFLRELPLALGALGVPGGTGASGAELAVGPTDEVVRRALAHMGMLADVRRRGLEQDFVVEAQNESAPPAWPPRPARPRRSKPKRQRNSPPPDDQSGSSSDLPPEDVPF